jgi:hypothetical protein
MNSTQKILLAGLTALACGVVQAEEAAKPAIAPDQAMMDKMQALNAPSDAHKVLESYAGKWTFTSKFSMGPDAPALVMDGTSDNSLIYGGRFLKQDVRGTWQGAPFEGIGYLGYDNVKQEYVSIWMDSTATALITESGQYDSATKTLKASGVNSCPMTGEKARVGRSEIVLVDADHYNYKARSVGLDGNEMIMEIFYTRAK